MPGVSIIDAATGIFSPWFRDPETWRPWFAALRSLFGLPLSTSELELFQQCTGRAQPPAGGATEAWFVCGRRAGKSLILAMIAVYLATARDWAGFLSPGERGTIMVLAADRRQARTIFRYARAFVGVPQLADLIDADANDRIDLSNFISIEIMTASFRGTRGYTVIACLADEIAFWRSEESANPDEEILAAIRPAMATIPGAMLLCVEPLLEAGRLMVCISAVVGQGRRSGARLAGPDPRHESDRAEIHHR